MSAVDSLGCATPATATALRMYRRPLPTANTAFQTTVMWDGRENVNPPNNTPAVVLADLAHQSNDATRGSRARGDRPVGRGPVVDRQRSRPVPSTRRSSSGCSNSGRATVNGGARFLDANVLPGFSIGVNDVFSPSFSPTIFTLYAAWEPGAQPGASGSQAAQIGRGEALFNQRTFTIDAVRGINSADPDDGDPISGTFTGSCGTCHDTPNIGNHSVTLPIDIGITAASPVGGLDIENLPTYTFQQMGTGKTITVTDPGRGLISGKFKDIGKTKGPNLRGARRPSPVLSQRLGERLERRGRFLQPAFPYRLHRPGEERPGGVPERALIPGARDGCAV